ncbi:DNA-processing protein DprA [Spartinivicinus poritis]|uniref:DNA-processing protein DprA n=1 Tax=Spartinivicinus poritis TaxID=2994640 RepID=A0ABT5UBR3_9GAMM|nr:DNA-processing protein DprA [Spartinivicinus sp. A2-2]MDE1463821.1 DNA-processing protein DprA [Spartinivicinus sp. A2-2]
MSKQITWQKLSDWVLLHSVSGVGANRFSQLVARFGSPTQALQQPASKLSDYLPAKSIEIIREIQQGAGKEYDQLQSLLVKTEQWLEHPNHHLIACIDECYPRAFNHLTDPPPLLFAVGNPDLLELPQLSIVGSRHPSKSGEENSYHFANTMAKGGFTITSGLADGVDAAAHKGALDAEGHTIAVVGTGLDLVYPAKNKALAERISQDGLLISEFPLGTKPQASNFPRRNRLISCLGLGVLVVEAALQSGSLITARLAAEQGREVFAIPGSIHNPLSKGCHQLIRQGAKLVDSVEHIWEELKHSLNTYSAVRELSIAVAGQEPEEQPVIQSLELEDPNQQQVLDAIGDETTSMDMIMARTGLAANDVNNLVLELEMQGFIAAVPGGVVRNPTQ